MASQTLLQHQASVFCVCAPAKHGGERRHATRGQVSHARCHCYKHEQTSVTRPPSFLGCKYTCQRAGEFWQRWARAPHAFVSRALGTHAFVSRNARHGSMAAAVLTPWLVLLPFTAVRCLNLHWNEEPACALGIGPSCRHQDTNAQWRATSFSHDPAPPHGKQSAQW